VVVMMQVKSPTMDFEILCIRLWWSTRDEAGRQPYLVSRLISSNSMLKLPFLGSLPYGTERYQRY
jgi:hypothetical protein